MAMAARPQDVNALLSRRRLTVIPKDQLALLDRSDSWAVDLVNEAHGLTNVPGHVLQTVKEAYIAGQQAQRTGRGNQTREENGSRLHNGRDGIPGSRSASPVAPPLNRQMSWSLSPPEHRQSRRRFQESPASGDAPDRPSLGSSPPCSRVSQHPASPRRTPRRRIFESPSPSKASRDASRVLSSPLVQTSRPSPSSGRTPQKGQRVVSPAVQEPPNKVTMAPPPPRRPSPPPRPAPAFEFYSSDNEEEATEVSRSQANSQNGSVNRHLPVLPGGSGAVNSQEQATNTPPCAQLSQSVAPETDIKANSPVKEETGAEPRRRQRIMKRHTFSDDSPVVVKSRKVLGPAPNFVEVDSTGTIPSSVIPSTMPEAPTQKSSGSPLAPKAGSEAQLTDSSPDETLLASTTQTVMNVENHSFDSTPGNTASTSLELQERHAPPQKFSIVEDSKTSEPINLLANGFPDPFHSFALIYPTYTDLYSGSLSRFTRACVCLEYLRQERALKDFLYDDFIRSFSVGFLAYVMNAGPEQEPLPAVEWYNNQSGSPIYTKMVVHKKNLDVILNAYPEEVAEARAVITANTQPTEEVIRPTTNALGHDVPSEAENSPPRPAQNHQPERPSSTSSTPVPSEQRNPSSVFPPRDLATPASSLSRRRPSRYLERLASGSRSSMKRKAEDHSERVKRHLKQRLSSGTTSFVSSGSRVDSTPNP